MHEYRLLSHALSLALSLALSRALSRALCMWPQSHLIVHNRQLRHTFDGGDGYRSPALHIERSNMSDASEQPFFLLRNARNHALHAAMAFLFKAGLTEREGGSGGAMLPEKSGKHGLACRQRRQRARDSQRSACRRLQDDG
jgi:hypothetical protein